MSEKGVKGVFKPPFFLRYSKKIRCFVTEWNIRIPILFGIRGDPEGD